MMDGTTFKDYLAEGKQGKFILYSMGKTSPLKSKLGEKLVRELKADDFSMFSMITFGDADEVIQNGQDVFVAIDPYAEDVANTRKIILGTDLKKLKEYLRQRAMDI